jgi:hypothetical protein
MERRITGFHCDDEGDLIAEVACGHGQYVRHRPPFQLRAWALEEEGRKTRLGTVLGGPLCDRCELPEDKQVVGSSPVGMSATGHWNCDVLTALRVALGGDCRFTRDDCVSRHKPSRRSVWFSRPTQPK